ncbi:MULTISPECIES: helicase-related protein [Dethiosulfovibrio]|uniref:Helicase C-terminal domain-containing protein n=1 Tax=Dethiosulfovibrio marinus TaxID=133532 RepID=A0ABS9EJE3_9BACT|nr:MULTISPECIES: helicase-related protein [Dethiosulfovibrio]MCF4141310.1 hypothetical protein [Dethiosulfovibrio marinus]
MSLEGRCFNDFATGDKGTLSELAERLGENPPPWDGPGIRALGISGRTKKADRPRILDAVRSGETKVLVAVNVADEGLYLPELLAYGGGCVKGRRGRHGCSRHRSRSKRSSGRPWRPGGRYRYAYTREGYRWFLPCGLPLPGVSWPGDGCEEVG